MQASTCPPQPSVCFDGSWLLFRRGGPDDQSLPSLQPIDWVDVCQGAHCGEGLSCAVAMQRFEVRDVLGRLCRPRLRARPARRGFA